MLAPGVSTTCARAPTANGVIRECSPALCSHAFGVPKQMDVLRHYCLLCSHIGKPRWAAVAAGTHVVDTPAAGVVAYARELRHRRDMPALHQSRDKDLPLLPWRRAVRNGECAGTPGFPQPAMCPACPARTSWVHCDHFS